MADGIWTGSVMRWSPPRRFTYVTALEDQVPPRRLGDLVDRLLGTFVEAGGRPIISGYTSPDDVPRDLFGDLAAAGHEPNGGSSSSDLAAIRSSRHGSTHSRPLARPGSQAVTRGSSRFPVVLVGR